MSKLTYSQYKPSKTFWQNDIPSHWQETDLRMVFSENKVKNEDLIERNLLSLSYGKLKRKDIDNATGLVPASFKGYQILGNGYIVLRFTDLQNDKKSLRVGYCNERGIITNAYVAIAPKEKTYSKYYYYLLHFLDTIKYFYNLGGGVRQSLSFKEFARETVLVPEREEQIKIAAFLEYKLAKIDRFIAKKKQLIELLNEQKTTIINQVVTKGLDLKAKMKPSEIEWVGDIPEHWRVKRIKHLANTFNGSTPKSDKSEFWNGNINWVTPEDISKVNNSQILKTKRKITKEGLESCGTTLVPKGSVILTTRAPIGNIAITDIELCTNQGCKTLVPKSTISGIHLLHFLSANKPILESLGRGTTFMELSTYSLRNLKIAFSPNTEENLEILGYINIESQNINKAISTIEKEIVLTQEYRTAIIAEAVTGKIDVRDYDIPEMPEEETYEDLEEELSLVAEDTTEYKNEE